MEFHSIKKNLEFYSNLKQLIIDKKNQIFLIIFELK